MRIELNADMCTGHGRCYALAPEIFDAADEGHCIVRVDGEVPTDLDSAEEAEASPLAERLFAVRGVTGVYFGYDFVTVSKDETDWQHLKPAILGAIMEHYMSGAPIMASAGNEEIDTQGEFYDEGDINIVNDTAGINTNPDVPPGIFVVEINSISTTAGNIAFSQTGGASLIVDSAVTNTSGDITLSRNGASGGGLVILLWLMVLRPTL